MADRAREYTLAYFSALRERLRITAEGGRPAFNPAEINEFSIAMLGNDLQSLYSSSLRDDALVDIEAVPRDEKLIQTTAVGFATDFDTFIKLGFLLGERVVLWDSIILGFLQAPANQRDLLGFGRVVCEILSLEPIVEQGGLILLPAPRD